MKIIVDSLEKWTQQGNTDTHIKDYFDKRGIEYEVRRLNVGDYMLDVNPLVTIDRKQNLGEVSNNLFQDYGRFSREAQRAIAARQKLIILVEHSGKVKSLQDVQKWKSKYGRVSGAQLRRAMESFDMKYGVKPPNDFGIVWAFCDKRSTARRIVEILGEETYGN